MIKKRITPNQMEDLNKIVDGTKDINSKASQKLLDIPHVRIAFETILDNANLTDELLAKKLSDIVNRKETVSVSVKTGSITTNQTSIDANTIQAIRMLWQTKGKFTEKIEAKIDGQLKNMPEEQLDNIIAQGFKFIRLRKDNLNDREPAPDGNSSEGTARRA